MPGERPLPRLARRLPRWWRAALGAVLVLLGLWLLTRPLTSLTVLVLYIGVTLVLVGAGEVLAARESGARVRARLGVLWVLVGLVALLAPGWSAIGLPFVVAAALVVSGVVRSLRARRNRGGQRWTMVLLGVSEVLLAVAAVLVPDVVLVLVGLLFGLRALVLGVQLLWNAVLDRAASQTSETQSAPPGPRWWRRVRPVVIGGGSVALALIVLTGALLTQFGSPRIDDFYSSDGVSTDDLAQPGRLLRAEPFARQVPDEAQAWRILYSTVDHTGEPTTASGIVMVPRTTPAAGGRPVVAWAHGTTGQARQCAPSLLSQPFTAGAFPEVMDEVVDRGWAVVATDYVGLGAEGTHAYLVGNVSGTAVLDAVRAARAIDEAHVSDDTVVWGHSQGGAAALWAAQEQPTHAPDVPLLGTVAMAPAADVPALADKLGSVAGGQIFASYVATGYAYAYDDVRLRDAVRTPALGLVERLSARCLAEPGVVASALTALSLRDEDILKGEVTHGALGARLSENVPAGVGISAGTAAEPSPVWVAQGADDALITPQLQGGYVQRVRRAGGEIDYTVYEGLDHLTLVQDGSQLLQDLLTWTSRRFAGR